MDGLTLIRHVRPQFYLSLYFVKPSPAIRSSVFPIKRLTPLMTMMMIIIIPSRPNQRPEGPKAQLKVQLQWQPWTAWHALSILLFFSSVGMRLVLLVLLVTRLTSQLDHKSSFL
jgi:cobalamin synthase